MVITSGWAFAVMAGVFTAIACGSSDAHLNPAVTMGFAISSGHFGKFAPFLLAQMAGAFVGAVLVWVHFLPHGKETPDQTLKLACFCTGPAIRRFGANLISEIVGSLSSCWSSEQSFRKQSRLPARPRDWARTWSPRWFGG
jgi:glycerol uptake facilitator